MKAPHCLGVAFGGLAGHFPVAFERVFEVVLIHKIVARVVRRIDVDHLDTAEIRRLQQFQDFQIVAFDVQILRGLEIDAFFRARTECCRGALLGKGKTLALALPGEFVLLKILEDVFASEREQLVDIQLALNKALRENRSQLFAFGLFDILGEAGNLHFASLHSGSDSGNRGWEIGNS